MLIHKLTNLSTPSNIMIISPIGGFANHIRNLCILTKQIQFKLSPPKDKYETFAGSSWPSYDEFCSTETSSFNNEFEKNILSLIPNHHYLKFIRCITLEDKINFLNDDVYPTTRTWQNWLWYEWLFRTQLDTIIPIFHEINQLRLTNFNHAPYKIIICTIDPNLALKMYMKLNSNLNNLPINTFLSKIEESNNINSKFHQEHSNRSILIKVDNLFNPILDQSIYDTIVDFTNFDYLYDECQPIHNRWFNLHKKSEKEFVEYITNFYL